MRLNLLRVIGYWSLMAVPYVLGFQNWRGLVAGILLVIGVAACDLADFVDDNA